jgi:drug/metabolite transporter (DMT)-like permease
MEGRNKGLIVFGIALLIIGLVASFYQEQVTSSSYPYKETVTPYQSVGILLDVAGIVFVALGLLYPTRKTPPPPTNPQQPSST